ncbi:MAG: methyltransferase domain-containing protein [Alcaligenaceae bacterium]|nr:methyltransferase domain-containing protein [Alcaligenaceae bacterium]
MSQAIHSPQTLPINSRHVVQQFSRRGLLEDSRFFYDEISRRMIERLRYIKVNPTTLVDVGCGPGHSLDALRQRFDGVRLVGIDSCPAFIKHCQQTRLPKGVQAWVSKLGRKASDEFHVADMAKMPLAAESAEVVWSNMALHWHPEPHTVIAEWRRITKVGGLCMFSCLGPGTFIELRKAVETAGISTATVSFVDMHDFGDILLENGFVDPVMDQEIITLTYKTPQKLLADVYALGGNPSIGRQAGLAGRQWHARLCEALEQQRKPDGTLHLSLEVAYGHAWKSAVHKTVSGETHISLSAIGGRKTGM